MKTILLALLLLTGCASKCPACLTMTTNQLSTAMEKAWIHGWDKGFDDGEDAANLKRLKSL